MVDTFLILALFYGSLLTLGNAITYLTCVISSKSHCVHTLPSFPSSESVKSPSSSAAKLNLVFTECTTEPCCIADIPYISTARNALSFTVEVTRALPGKYCTVKRWRKKARHADAALTAVCSRGLH